MTNMKLSVILAILLYASSVNAMDEVLAENARLRSENTLLSNALTAENARSQAEIAQLRAEIAMLQAKKVRPADLRLSIINHHHRHGHRKAAAAAAAAAAEAAWQMFMQSAEDDLDWKMGDERVTSRQLPSQAHLQPCTRTHRPHRHAHRAAKQ